MTTFQRAVHEHRYDYPIDKHVPQPGVRTGNRKYPLPELKVGDSFFVPNGKLSPITGSILRVEAADRAPA